MFAFMLQCSTMAADQVINMDLSGLLYKSIWTYRQKSNRMRGMIVFSCCCQNHRNRSNCTYNIDTKQIPQQYSNEKY